mmetsp:Transcript_9929/g.21834  ORF Transcript_9929/g.21834 Transcript_9929/m.21834 type:complete len:96 (+) Transcript_9929:104-391(+)
MPSKEDGADLCGCCPNAFSKMCPFSLFFAGGPECPFYHVGGMLRGRLRDQQASSLPSIQSSIDRNSGSADVYNAGSFQTYNNSQPERSGFQGATR